MFDSLYNRVGGEAFFFDLVNKFYEFVETDSLLRPLYPANLEPGKTYLALFLAQYWGGPPHYSLKRGHPRLRMRHFNFPIGQAERDAWVTHMASAIETSHLKSEDSEQLKLYLEQTATFLMNT